MLPPLLHCKGFVQFPLALRHKHKHVLAGGGAIVETGAKDFAGELHHEQPLIYCNGSAIIILYGFLSNVEELLRMVEKDAASPSFFKRMHGNASLSSRRFQSQSFAAEALLQVYLQTKCSNLLIMLSELQVMNLCMQPFPSTRHSFTTVSSPIAAAF